MKRETLGLAIAATLVVIGCVPSTPGELGKGSFTYVCAPGLHDAACSTYESNSSVPPRIAVGGLFGVRLSSSDEYSVISASPEMISGSEDAFSFEKPGFGALLGVRAGTVGDFLHATGVAVDHIRLRRQNDDVGPTFEMEVGDSLVLEAEPVDASDAVLAGGFTYKWSLAGTGVTLAPPNTSTSNAAIHKARLDADAEGTAELTVQVAGLTQTVQIVVGGAP